jgi:hypothetical protein
MSDNDTIRKELDHILEMCHELGSDEIRQVFYTANSAATPYEIWRALLNTQDVIREQIYLTEQAQIKLERQRQAMLILNRYIAVMIHFHLAPKVSSAKWVNLLRRRKEKRVVEEVDEEEATTSGSSSSGGEEEIVFGQGLKKRQRTD